MIKFRIRRTLFAGQQVSRLVHLDCVPGRVTLDVRDDLLTTDVYYRPVGFTGFRCLTAFFPPDTVEYALAAGIEETGMAEPFIDRLLESNDPVLRLAVELATRGKE